MAAGVLAKEPYREPGQRTRHEYVLTDAGREPGPDPGRAARVGAHPPARRPQPGRPVPPRLRRGGARGAALRVRARRTDRGDGGHRTTRLTYQAFAWYAAPVDLTESAEDRAFREEVRTWLADHLSGEWGALRGLGGPGREHEAHDERLAWNRHLAEHGWTALGWPVEHGGRGLSLWQQVVFHEEYARANAPAGVNHLGEQPARPHPDRVRHRRAAAALPARDRRGARACGRRATPSPVPARTWRTCRPGRGWSRRARPAARSG
ncbi:acyl-CoA dehydrogenase family protein [Nocardioides convexus]|uniref:acyl-CoA dehydrogenase family protein n=1 Tax=Nocardioides convexus TaxID=2712224 RepID=UPI0031012749